MLRNLAGIPHNLLTPNEMEKLAELLRAAVERGKSVLGLSQERVAAMSGITRTTLGAAMRTGEGIGFGALEKISDAVELGEEERIELLYAKVEKLVVSSSHGKAFIQAIQRMNKHLPGERVREMKALVVQIYREEEGGLTEPRRS